MGGVKKTSLSFLDPPFEIRHIVYKLYFMRPFGIVPGFVYHRQRIHRLNPPFCGCQFEDVLQTFLSNPSSEDPAQPVYNGWNSTLSPEQEHILASGGSVEVDDGNIYSL
jgi:hypothetical protein